MLGAYRSRGLIPSNCETVDTRVNTDNALPGAWPEYKACLERSEEDLKRIT
jgi:hypothetical protein